VPQIVPADRAFLRVPATDYSNHRARLEADLVALERRRHEFVVALLDVLADLRAVDLLIAGARAERAGDQERQL
jgi:hypothetical protein